MSQHMGAMAYNNYMYNKRASRIIHEADPDVPFYMFLSLQDAHLSLQAPPQFMEYYDNEDYLGEAKDRQVYNAMMSSVDSIIANVTEALINTGHYDNTIIILSSDNGGTSEHNGPVQGVS